MRRKLWGLKRGDDGLLRRPDGRYPHAYLPEVADAFARGRVDRRGFLRTACLIGLSAGAAYAFAGRIDGGPAALPTAAAQVAPRQGGELHFAMEVMGIADPATFAWPQQANVTRWIVEYLTRTGPDNVTLPYLAEGWEASDDLRTWTFPLRREVRWSNGDPFTADDVVANFQRWLDPDRRSSNRSLFAGLGERIERDAAGGGTAVRRRLRDGAVERVDAHTVRLHLLKPDLSVPENLYNYPAAILHRDFDRMGGDLAANPVGTGPYRLAAFAEGQEALLTRRESYWGAQPNLEAIRYLDGGRDRRQMLGALIAGEVDGVFEVDVMDLPALDGRADIQLHSVPTARTGVCRMRVDTPPFDDRRVRRAVQLAADNPKLLELGYRRRGVVAENHHVGPMHPEYAKLPAVARDVTGARALLAEAGYPNGLQLTLSVGNVQGRWEQAVAEVMRDQLAVAGIELRLDVMAPSAYARAWTEVAFGMTAWTHRPLGVMALNLGYRSGQAWNESRYANPTFDAKLDQANGLLDPNDRRAVMAEVQAILQDDAVIVQPFWRNQYVATHRRVRGFQSHPTQYHQFQDVWLAEA